MTERLVERLGLWSVARLLRWYPSRWRRCHGDEFAALRHVTIDDGPSPSAGS